jgi:hypothetical protein
MNAPRPAHRLTRRLRSGLSGWGGVGAMAAVCALALAFALLLPLTTRPSGADGVTSGGRGVAHGSQIKVTDCEKKNDAQDRSLSPSGGGATTVIDRIKARKDRRLVVGVDTNSYRWGYLNPNNVKGELEGFDIDLVHRIAKDILGDPDAVSFKAIPTSRRIDAIQHDEVDMVVRTMTITCQRSPLPTSGPASRSSPPRPRRSRGTTARSPTRGSARPPLRRRWTGCRRTGRPAGSRPARTSRRWCPTSSTAW